MQRETELEWEDRPWGSWRIVDSDVGYQVKRIRVLPGQRLSVQTHRYRSEHWVVVSGVATCLIGSDTMTALPGECADVPLGVKHRLANQGPDPLVVVEVQCGSYLGEDDIQRYEDDYGRCIDPPHEAAPDMPASSALTGHAARAGTAMSSSADSHHGS